MPGPAATQGSQHICPMTTGTTPHVGGPVMGGATRVLIGGKPAAMQGDICICQVGNSDTIVQGVTSVLIEGKPAATIGDMTAHGGVIISGEASVLIGTGGALVEETEVVETISSSDKTMEENDLPFLDLNF